MVEKITIGKKYKIDIDLMRNKFRSNLWGISPEYIKSIENSPFVKIIYEEVFEYYHERRIYLTFNDINGTKYYWGYEACLNCFTEYSDYIQEELDV